MAAGYWVRWRVMQIETYQIDEFISMLAIQMILEKAAPILPSGLYYDHGLIYSYLGALFAWLSQGDLLAARWWSLIAGLLCIGLAYYTGWRLFHAPFWSLLAAAGFAFHTEAIQWATRVRMYSQANLIFLLWILLLWLGTLGGNHRWARIGFGFALLAGIYTHSALLLALPPLLLAIFVVWLMRQKGDLPRPSTNRANLLEGLFVIGILSLTLWGVTNGFVASYTVDSSVPAFDEAAVNRQPLTQVISPALSQKRWQALRAYLANPFLLPYLLFAAAGFVLAIVRLARSHRTRSHQTRQTFAALYMSLALVGILFEFLFLLADDWQSGRYRYLLIFPLVLLLAVYGLQAAFHMGRQWLQRPFPLKTAGMALMAGILLCLVWFGTTVWNEVNGILSYRSDTPNPYNIAFEYVNQRRAREDTVMTIRPAAGYLFADQFDYYANHRTPVIIPGEMGWIDGYTGRPYIDSPAQLNQILAQPGHLWIVIDEDRLFGYLEPVFTQQLLWETDIKEQIDNVLILSEVEEKAAAITPEQTLSAAWANNIRLSGYSTQKNRAGEPSIEVTTLWQDSRPLWVYKVFIHLRDSQGQVVAQADFTPLEKIHPALRNRMISQAGPDQIPLSTTLHIDPSTKAGTYYLYLGLYNGTTFERVPILEDTGEENAILLGALDW